MPRSPLTVTESNGTTTVHLYKDKLLTLTGHSVALFGDRYAMIREGINRAARRLNLNFTLTPDWTVIVAGITKIPFLDSMTFQLPVITEHAKLRFSQRITPTKDAATALTRLLATARPISPTRYYSRGKIVVLRDGEIKTVFRPTKGSAQEQVRDAFSC